MKSKWWVVLAALILCAACVDYALAFGLARGNAASVGAAPTQAVTVIAGAAVPQSQTNLQPSMSTWDPSCLDATWGAGCNTSTQKCIAPTSGAPLETCQAPLQLVVTGGSGNGATGEIDYTSYAGFTLPVGQPLNIKGSGVPNWETPTGQITSYSAAIIGAGPNYAVTVTYSGSALPFHVGAGPVYVGGMTASDVQGSTTVWGWGWPNTSPNGVWTLTAVAGSTATFTVTGTVTGSIILNPSGYSGTITQPAVATASSCAGTACKVQFANATSCASACATGATQIVAGQNDSIILAWDSGPFAPYAVENGTITKCVDAQHISPSLAVYFAVDGGAFVKATTQMLDPWGAGASGLTNTVKVFCGQISASTLADGVHEWRAIGIPTVGRAAQLSSALTVDALTSGCNPSGCAWLNAAAHGLGGAAILGISKSQDPAFTPYNWLFNNTAGITVTGATFCAAGSSAGVCANSPSTPPRVVYAFTQPTTMPAIPAHTNVNINSTITADLCTITGGTANGATIVYNYTGSCTYPAGSLIDVASVVVSAGSGAGALYAWNGTNIPVVASTAGTITVASLSTAVYASGGTAAVSWDQSCVTIDTAAASGSFTCPVAAATPTTTWASGGLITATGNQYCTVGGNGDEPSPYDPAWTPLGLMQPDAFQLQPYLVNSCSNGQNATGCHANTGCGVIPTINSTLWLYRKDAGTQEWAVAGNFSSNLNNNGSFWSYTNFNGTIQKRDSYADSWDPASVSSGCVGPTRTAGSAAPAYAGTYCTDLNHARNALPFTTAGVTETAGNSGGCLTLTAAGNSGLYVGEPVNFQGADLTTGGGQLMNYGLYWVGSVVSTTVTLSTVPVNGTASCITTTAGNLVSPKLFADLSFDSVRLRCHTSLGCTSSNPELFSMGVAGAVGGTFYAKAGWFELLPDTANGTTQNEVSYIQGQGGVLNFSTNEAQGGRTMSSLNSVQAPWVVTPLIPITATPGVLSALTGSNSGASETLTFATTGGPLFQAADATGSPGQQITITGSANATFNCAACNVIASTVTSVTFTNPVAPTGSFTGTATITPETLVVEITAGSLANAGGGVAATCASPTTYLPITPAPGAVACLSQLVGTAPGLFPLFAFPTNGGVSSHLIHSAGCFYTTGGATFVAGANTSTGSGINDTLILSSGVSAHPILAFSTCDQPLVIGNNVATLAGFTSQAGSDVWANAVNVSGPDYTSDSGSNKGALNFEARGMFYITGSTKNNVQSAFDGASYVWGTSATNNLGLCGNGTKVIFNSHCQGGETMVDTIYSNNNVNGMAVTDAFDVNGTRTTCNGSDPCITTSTLTIQVNNGAPGGMPFHLSPGWTAYGVCDYANPFTGATRGLATSTVTSFDDNVGRISASTTFGAGAACDIATDNPHVLTINTFHIDAFFTNVNQNPTPSGAPYVNYSPWIYFMNTLYDNVSNQGSGTMEGYVNQGTTYINDAFVNSIVQATEDPSPGIISSFESLGFNGYGFTNLLFRNSAIWGGIRTSHVTDVTGMPPQTDTFFINVNGGLRTNFPLGNPNDIRWIGFGGLTGLAFSAPVGSSVGTQNIVAWPSLTAGVDGAGAPSVPGSAWAGSLGACPWYCLAADTGLGSQ